jgi:hypothetical protein
MCENDKSGIQTLFCLPRELLEEILCYWLPVFDFVLCFDAAVTNHAVRSHYLQYLQEYKFTCPSLVVSAHPHSEMELASLKWFSRRSILLREVIFRTNFTPEQLQIMIPEKINSLTMKLYTEELTSSDIKSICALRSLTVLSLSVCDVFALADYHLLAVFQCCSVLRKLTVISAKEVTKMSLQYLNDCYFLETGSSSLKEIHFLSCSQMKSTMIFENSFRCSSPLIINLKTGLRQSKSILSQLTSLSLTSFEVEFLPSFHDVGIGAAKRQYFEMVNNYEIGELSTRNFHCKSNESFLAQHLPVSLPSLSSLLALRCVSVPCYIFLQLIYYIPLIEKIEIIFSSTDSGLFYFRRNTVIPSNVQQWISRFSSLLESVSENSPSHPATNGVIYFPQLTSFTWRNDCFFFPNEDFQIHSGISLPAEIPVDTVRWFDYNFVRVWRQDGRILQDILLSFFKKVIKTLKRVEIRDSPLSSFSLLQMIVYYYDTLEVTTSESSSLLSSLEVVFDPNMMMISSSGGEDFTEHLVVPILNAYTGYCETKVNELLSLLISKTGKSLRFLTYNRRGMVDRLPDFVNMIFPKLVNLEYLDLSDGLATDELILTVSFVCSRLKFLDLRNCEFLSDKAIISLMMYCGSSSSSSSRLKKLYLCGCMGLSEVSLLAIASFGSALEVLNIANLPSKCYSIKTLLRIVRNCISLKTLFCVTYYDYSVDVASVLENIKRRLHDSVRLSHQLTMICSDEVPFYCLFSLT